MSLPSPPLLVITDRRQADRPIEEIAAAALRGGCRWLSVREKDLPQGELVPLVARIVAIGHAAGARVTVHGSIEAAAQAGTDGVHLGAGGSVTKARQLLGSRALIGISAHSVAEAIAAERDGAHYTTLSPIFQSASKPTYGPPIGCRGLKAAAGLAIPVIALGGITAANAVDCIATGAAGIAVMGAIMRATDPEAETARFVAALNVSESAGGPAKGNGNGEPDHDPGRRSRSRSL